LAIKKKNLESRKMISFFYGNYGSGEIRGKQMGTFLGAKLNPEDNYKDDVCIYVKQQPPENFPLKSYLDIVDGVGLIPWIKNHPNCGVITTSFTGKRFLENNISQKPVYIPENHCNYRNDKRTRKEIKRVGGIGELKGFGIPFEVVKEELNKKGLEFVFCDNYKSRNEVCEFYKSIDIQVCWRPHVKGAHAQLHNPLKLANACSFGIPTVSYPEDNFVAEFKDIFIEAPTIEDFFDSIFLLQDESIYDYYSEKGIEAAKKYHIKNVKEYYEALR